MRRDLRFGMAVIPAMIAACDGGAGPRFDPVDAATVGDGAAESGAQLDAAGVTVPPATYTPIGSPTWRLRCEQTTFPAPTDPQGYVQAFARFIARGIDPEHTTSAPQYAVGRGAPHAPPYDIEPGRIFGRAGAPPRAVYRRDEVDTAGSHLVLCVVYAADGAPRGRTADGADLPMLTGDRFPLAEQHDYQIGPDVLGADRDAIPYPVTGGVDGVSHLLLRWGKQVAFEPRDRFPIASEFRLTLTDSQGQGYRVVIPFVVLDSPS